MKFKHPHIQDQFVKTDPILQLLANDFVMLSRMLDIEPVVTRVSDPVAGESGVHTAMRAIDFRDQNSGEFLYSQSERQVIMDFLNTKYERSDRFKAVMWHSFRGGMNHWHLQVPYDRAVFKRRLV